MSFPESERKFEIVEVDVFEENDLIERDVSHIGVEDPPASVNKNQDTTAFQESVRRRNWQTGRNNSKTRKNKYGWAFFLCSFFIGLGLTATLPGEPPLAFFGGLGIGFLFFVDPIYQKLMEKIENL